MSEEKPLMSEKLLLDDFAIQVMQGLIANSDRDICSADSRNSGFLDEAKFAYEMAQALVLERVKHL